MREAETFSAEAKLSSKDDFRECKVSKLNASISREDIRRARDDEEYIIKEDFRDGKSLNCRASRSR